MVVQAEACSGGVSDGCRRLAVPEPAHSESTTLEAGETPPRPYDERRDDALVLSLLLDPFRQKPVSAAREAMEAALEFTIPEDLAWRQSASCSLFSMPISFFSTPDPPKHCIG